MPPTGSKLNRYTSLPVAIDILTNKHLTLLSPETWEDRNDAYYLERYREEKDLGCILAMCFATKSETFHHWKVFSGGSAGVCIEFHKAKLLKEIENHQGIRHGGMSYHWIDDFRGKKPPIDKWPFLKRRAFLDEGEYRFIYECDEGTLRSQSFKIDLSCINKVTLSPWLPESVANSVIKSIRRVDGCSKLPISRSSLINNAAWRKIIDKK